MADDDLYSALECLRALSPDTRVIGNVRASTLIAALHRSAAERAVLAAAKAYGNSTDAESVESEEALLDALLDLDIAETDREVTK